MPYYSGQHGRMRYTVQEGNSPAQRASATVKNWSFTTSLATLDTTNLGDTDRTTTAGIRSHKGNCQIFYYTDDPATKANNSASDLINSLIKRVTNTSATGAPGVAAESAVVRFEFALMDGSATTGRIIAFNARITGASMTMAVGEVFGANLSWEATGAPVEMTL